MALSTLVAIRDKVRKITRSPSAALLTDAQIDEYVNTVLQYDLPSQLRLFNLRTNLTFYTQPNVDVYETNTVVTTDPLYNFKNRYIAVHPPVFLAGIQGFYTQWRDEFYGYYPQTNTIADTQLRGDGTTGPFAGTLFATPVLQNNVVFTVLNAAGTAMILVDTPTTNVLGTLNIPNGTVPIPGNTINYLTGAFTLNFPANTQTGAPIMSDTIPYQAGKPIAILYYEDKFTIRPVPDKVYTIQIEADIRPTELLSANQSPELEQWWQYIAMLSAKKVFEDKMDYDSINMLIVSIKEQEAMVLSRTLTQQVNSGTVTIYNQGKSYGSGWSWGNWPY